MSRERGREDVIDISYTQAPAVAHAPNKLRMNANGALNTLPRGLVIARIVSASFCVADIRRKEAQVLGETIRTLDTR